MIINVTFKNGRPVITVFTPSGGVVERMPGVRAVSVDYHYREGTEVTIKLAVDGKNVSLGEWDDSEDVLSRSCDPKFGAPS